MKAWVAAAKSAARASMVNQVATPSLAPIYKLVLLAAGVSLAGWLLSYNWGTLAASRCFLGAAAMLPVLISLRAQMQTLMRGARLAANSRPVVGQPRPLGLLDR